MTFSDSKISKEDKDWLYLQMIKVLKKVKDSIILVFSPTRLSKLSELCVKHFEFILFQDSEYY